MSERREEIGFRSGFELAQLYQKKNPSDLLSFKSGESKKVTKDRDKKKILSINLWTTDGICPIYRLTKLRLNGKKIFIL